MKIERHFLISHLTPVHYTKFAHWIVWDIWAYIHNAWCMVYGEGQRREYRQQNKESSKYVCFKLADAENKK